MRPDINKVLCERERQGFAGDWARTQKHFYTEAHRARPGYEDRESEYERLEALPKHESMTARFGGSIRMFGENLGALKGWVRSLVGNPWDAAYSELCRLCPPTGNNTQRHAHQHLDGYIERMTVVMDDGSIGYNTKFSWKRMRTSLYMPIADSRCDYYVHPKTKLVCVNKRKHKKKISWKEANRQKLDAVLKIYPKHVMAKLHGIWYVYQIEEEYMQTSKVWCPVKQDMRTLLQVANPDQLRELFFKEHGELYGRGKLNYTGNARNKQQMNSRELKKFGLTNDRAAA